MTEVPQRKRLSTFYGGLESLLDGAAALILFLGVCSAVAVLAMLRLSGVLPALSALVSAVTVWLILRALAELIRLQKKAAGLAYSGKISAAREEVSYTCSECGRPLYSEHRCDFCGCEISGGDEPPA